MNKFYISVVATLLFSCATRLNYLGSSLQPTNHVDVFVDAAAIRKTYTIIGKGYLESSIVSKERMQEQAIQKAMEKGADAVLFQDYFITDETSAYSISKPDSSGKSINLHRNKPASAVVNSQVSILFLKYD
jgi:hypothetical protein